MNPLLEKFEEYKSIVNYRFVYQFANGLSIEYKLRQADFPHLLGLHKLTDIPIIQQFRDVNQPNISARYILSRIKKDIVLPFPVLSNFECEVTLYKEDANRLIKKLDVVDLIYMDPPYNQHPYGSNYFMLNVINEYKKPKEVSKVSGIPKDWKRSKFNKAKEAFATFEELCSNAKARYLLISFNSDGFITKKQMTLMLSKIGNVTIMEKKYNTFRGSRNLNNRDIHVKEYLYLVEVFKYKVGR